MRVNEVIRIKQTEGCVSTGPDFNVSRVYFRVSSVILLLAFLKELGLFINTSYVCTNAALCQAPGKSAHGLYP